MITRMPTFTIALPVHNGMPYIAAAIESLLHQTYHQFDIVVLENGSTDTTVSVIEAYHDPRIRIVPSQKFLGIEDNWKRILDIETPSEFLVLMCADDIVFPTFLEEIVTLIQSEPAATLYHTGAIFMDEQGRSRQPMQAGTYRENACEFLSRLHTFREDVCGSGFVMRFADFQRVGGYPSFKRLLFADFYCYYALTRLGYKICSPTPLVGFRQHTQGMTSQSVIHDFVIAAGQYREMLSRDVDVDTRLLDQFLHKLLLVQYRRYVFDRIKHRHRDFHPAFEEYQHRFLVAPYPTKAFAYDFPMRWYVRLAKMPIWAIRIIFYYGLLIVISIRKKRMAQ